MTTQMQRRGPAPAALYRQDIERSAAHMLEGLIGSEQGQRAAARVALAFSAAARTSKDPDALYRCDRASVAACVAYSALTGLMPGGVNAECWLIPRGRELTWMVSHRGLIRLAREGGYNVRAIPVHTEDEVFRVEFGDVVEHESNPDRWPSSLDDLRGVYVVITEMASGTLIGRPWMPIAAIHERVKKAKTGPVWKQWPVEMAMKTAIKYVCARGYVPMSTEGQHAINADTRGEGVQEERPSVHQIGGMLPDEDFGDEVVEADDLPDVATMRTEIAAIDKRLPGALAIEAREVAGVGVTTSPDDDALTDEQLGAWWEAVTQAEAGLRDEAGGA